MFLAQNSINLNMDEKDTRLDWWINDDTVPSKQKADFFANEKEEFATLEWIN